MSVLQSRHNSYIHNLPGELDSFNTHCRSYTTANLMEVCEQQCFKVIANKMLVYFYVDTV